MLNKQRWLTILNAQLKFVFVQTVHLVGTLNGACWNNLFKMS